MSNPTDTFINNSGRLVRGPVRQAARFLNYLSEGKLTPNAVTITGLLAHLPIAMLIATRHDLVAAILLAIFGLFDALDGELARLQKRSGPTGMLLDATTDRFKEVMLFSAVAYNFISTGHAYLAVWAVIACGASLSVSYVKAKAEVAIATSGHTKNLNNQFKDGLMRFEIRIIILILGLLTNRLEWAIIFIAILASFTAIQRLINASRKLNVQN